MKKIVLFALLFASIISFGQEQKIEELNFTGLKRTKERFLRRLIQTKPNTTYDSITLALDIERLNRLAGIAKATYTLTKKPGGSLALTYNIVENFTIIPALRISQANDGSFAFRLSTFEFNFLGNNQLIGGFYEREVFDSYGAYWQNPFLFGNKVGLGFNYKEFSTQEPVFFSEGTKDYRFDNTILQGQVLFSFDFNNEAEFNVTFSDENYDFIGEDPIPDAPFNVQADRLIFEALYRYINVDIDYQYIDGISNEVSTEFFRFLNGGDQGEEFLGDFVSLRNDFIYYKKVKQRGNWASRVRLAAIVGNEDSPFAPFAVDNQLNIRGAGTTVDRGTASVVLNTEYRQTFYEKGWFVLQGNAFVDAGTWRSPGGDFSELFTGETARLFPGLGIRFIHKRIFNAVIRIDYGFGIGANATNGVTFGVGQFF